MMKKLILAQKPFGAYFKELDKAGVAVYGEANVPEGDLIKMIGSIIQASLGVIGIVLLVLVIYAGFLWMTARGNVQIVEKAKATLANAIIGLIIALTAYAISSFVIRELTASDPVVAEPTGMIESPANTVVDNIHNFS